MQAQRLPAQRGTFWLLEGFRLFRRNPPFITALTLLYLLIVQSMAVLLPGIGPILLPLLLPALTLIVANGCRLIDEGKRPGKDALLLGLVGNGTAMLRLGALQLVGALLLVLINAVINDGVDPLISLDLSTMPGEADAEGAESTEGAANPVAEAAMLDAMMRLMLIAAPLIIAFWFAPFLVGWDRVSPFKAIFFSTVASWRNWRAMGMFGVAVIVLAGLVPGLILILASQILGASVGVAFIAMRMMLIFLVAPVLTASIYISYRDIFHPRVDESV